MTLQVGLLQATALRKALQDSHLRGCCVQAAPHASTHPGTGGFRGLALLPGVPSQLRGPGCHITPWCQRSHPEPIPTLTSHLLHAEPGGWGVPTPGEGFAWEVPALPLASRRRHAAGFASPIPPSCRRSERLILTWSVPCLTTCCCPAISLPHHCPLVLLLIYSSSSPAASLR